MKKNLCFQKLENYDDIVLIFSPEEKKADCYKKNELQPVDGVVILRYSGETVVNPEILNSENRVFRKEDRGNKKVFLVVYRNHPDFDVLNRKSKQHKKQTEGERIREKSNYVWWKYGQLYGGKSPLEILIQMYPEKNWNFEELLQNPNINLDILNDIDANSKSINPNITWEIVRDNPNKPWNWAWLSARNPNITWDIIRDNPDKPWDWKYLSMNPNITSDIVRDNPDKPWDWIYLSRNQNITPAIVRDNPDKPWDWYSLSQNPNITWEIVRDNPDRPWNWVWLSGNPNITWEIVKNNTGIDWDWWKLSQNPNITWEIVRDNPDEPWEWKTLSRNPNITWEIIRDNPDKPWNCDGLSLNPNITPEIVRNNADKQWNFNLLSNNEFLFNDTLYKRELPKDIKRRKYQVQKFFLEKETRQSSKDIDKKILDFVGYF